MYKIIQSIKYQFDSTTNTWISPQKKAPRYFCLSAAIFSSLYYFEHLLCCGLSPGGLCHLIPGCVQLFQTNHLVLGILQSQMCVDVLGLCKVSDLSEIEAKGWSLTPGAYVGVAPVEDDGVDFEERMAEIHRELLSLQAESNDLMDTISQNMKEMGL